MKRILVGLAILLAVTVFGAVPYLNPERVSFQFAPDRVLQLPLGWLLLAAFALGATAVGLGMGVRQLGAALAGWPARQRERRARRVARLERDGLGALWEGELDRARAHLSKAWRAGAPAAALALAGSYVDAGDLHRARQVLNEAVTGEPNDPDLRCAQADVLRSLGQREEAIRILETVRVQHPRAPRVLAALRDLYQDCGRWAAAVAVQEAYVAVLGGSPRAAEERRRLLQFRYQGALEIADAQRRREELEAVVQADGTFVPALVSLGDTLVDCGRAADALKLWERSFRRTPRVIFIERLLEHHQSARDRQRDLVLLRKYREQMDGGAADSLRLLAARLFLDDDNTEAAAGELELLNWKDSPQALRLWAEVHRRRGNQQAAYETAIAVADRLGAGLSGYHCEECGAKFSSWQGYCGTCRRWDTVRSDAEPAPPA